MFSGTCKSFSLSLAASAAFVCGIGTLPAKADTFDWSAYMQTAAMAGAVTSAIAQVDHCSKPLTFEEITTDDASMRLLVVTCSGTEEEEASAILGIQRFGDGPWLPMGFEFAG